MEAARTNSISSKVRKNPVSRKKGQRFERRRFGRTKSNASIGLGRFHSVKLVPKFGIYVYDKLQVLRHRADDQKLQLVYNDLYPCFERYHELFYGHKPEKNFLEKATSTETAFAWMLTSLGTMLGDYISLEIYEPANDKEKYCFIAYQENTCLYDMHELEVGYAIKKMLRWYPKDLNVFVLFLRALCHTGCETWFYGHMHWILNETFAEEIHSGDLERKTVNLINKTIKEYTDGLPARIASEISNCHTHIGDDGKTYVDLDYLSQLNETITKCVQIKNIITAAIPLLKQGRTFYDYNFIPNQYYDRMGLTYDRRHSIIWDADDMLTGYYEENIQVDYQEGLFNPYKFLHITPECESLFIPDNWPRAMSKFFDFAADQLQDFAAPKTKKK
jgi:hypothetical protein